jgi:ATP/maltotriose-dependent transcriptional regulator MalT
MAAGLLFRGDMAPAMGWIGRGGRVLEDFEDDCPERAFLLVLTALPTMFQGDPAGAQPMFEEAAAGGRRFDDAVVGTMSRLGLAQSLVMQGRVTQGVALLDEIMIAVVAGEVPPLYSGIVYCATIDACTRMFDVRRAREWTAALSRWCDSQPDLVPYRGNCLVHRCEIMQLQGEWPQALEAAEQACSWLSGPRSWDILGSAYYQLAEIHRLRGDFDKAEETYKKASEVGRQPEPGMALLRLAQGRVDVADAVIRRVLDEQQDPSERSRVLPAFVDITLAAGDVGAARSAAEELVGIAAMIDAPLLHALAAQAEGNVLLAEGDARAALARLRTAATAWRDLEAPHEAARVRVQIGLACRALGDEATADLELAGARAAFEQLGAAPDVKRVEALTSDAKPLPGGLTAREAEVLGLVASGMTNRAIAEELVLSEKTVARHISNIFTKLGVSSRSAATAYAYEHGLV